MHIACSVPQLFGPLIKQVKILVMGAQQETVLQNAIRLALSAECPDSVMFRNHCGALRSSDGRMVQFGLHPGSPDLVGWRSIEITPDMVGHRAAIFTGIEIKTLTGRIRADQLLFLDRLRCAGGIVGVARSVTEAVSILRTHVTLPDME